MLQVDQAYLRWRGQKGGFSADQGSHPGSPVGSPPHAVVLDKGLSTATEHTGNMSHPTAGSGSSSTATHFLHKT